MCGFLTHLQNGVSNIWAIGQLESEMTISPAQAVIDDEIISYVKRYLRGIEVTQETLAVDITRNVGISGSFLDQMHTFEYFRSELFMPALLFRQTR
ncbi:MAG: trimethylamine methyltransferase family protein, partial [Deltaproteobacteria bacterium]|nr:trimethylamine methyltransferase family protein [Deltaproteobacteria bacterium]